MKKIIMCILLILFLLVGMVGCVNKVQQNDVKQEEPPKQNDTITTPQSEDNQIDVTLYFANNEYVATGNESLPKVLPETRKINVGEKPLAEAIVDELQKGPQNKDLSTALRSDIKILGVKVSDNTAFVNLSSENLHGGSLEELLVIEQITKSLNALEEVKQTQFLVDGKKAETLMGHADTTEPFPEEE